MATRRYYSRLTLNTRAHPGADALVPPRLVRRAERVFALALGFRTAGFYGHFEAGTAQAVHVFGFAPQRAGQRRERRGGGNDAMKEAFLVLLDSAL